MNQNEERFGKDGKEHIISLHIISLLYKEVPVRDDFYLKIVDKKYNTNDTNNYLVLKNNKNNRDGSWMAISTTFV